MTTKTIDALVDEWRSCGWYTPRPPATASQQAALLAFCQERYGFAPAADYARFLALCDGGQIDAAWFFGAAPEDACHLDNWPAFAIGDSGNVDVFVLMPDDSAEIRGLGYPEHAFEKFPSFTAMLAHFLAELPR